MDKPLTFTTEGELQMFCPGEYGKGGPNYLYLIEGHRCFKVGFSRNPRLRIPTAFACESPDRNRFQRAVVFPPSPHAKANEKKLHTALRGLAVYISYRRSREWYHTKGDLLPLVEKWLSDGCPESGIPALAKFPR